MVEKAHLEAKRDAAIARWDLGAFTLVADTATSRVFRAADKTGRNFALKLLKPYGADEMIGVGLLAWYGGHGAVEVVEQDDGVILMDWLDGPPLADLVRADHRRDAEATEIMCTVLRQLQATRPKPPPSLLR